jgi:hypothetical protein
MYLMVNYRTVNLPKLIVFSLVDVFFSIDQQEITILIDKNELIKVIFRNSSQFYSNLYVS